MLAFHRQQEIYRESSSRKRSIKNEEQYREYQIWHMEVQEELDELNLSVLYRRLLENSTAYMLMCRCGLEPDEYFDPEDFSEVFNFNTPETLNAGRGHTGYCRKRFERHRIDRPKPSKANSHNCAGTGK